MSQLGLFGKMGKINSKIDLCKIATCLDQRKLQRFVKEKYRIDSDQLATLAYLCVQTDPIWVENLRECVGIKDRSAFSGRCFGRLVDEGYVKTKWIRNKKYVQITGEGRKFCQIFSYTR